MNYGIIIVGNPFKYAGFRCRLVKKLYSSTNFLIMFEKYKYFF